MLKTLGTALTTALVAFVVAVITIPTDFVVGRLKFAINRADQREERYRVISDEVSKFVFEAQIFSEFLARDLDSKTVEGTIKDYNKAIVALRTHEYAHRATIRKYWSEKTAARFDNFMRDVRSIDAAAHGVNDPLIKFITDPAKPAILSDAAVKSVAVKLKPNVAKLCGSAEALLFSLADVDAPADRKTCE